MSSTLFKYNEWFDVVISRSDEVTTIDLFDTWRQYTVARCSGLSEKIRNATDEMLFNIIKNYFDDDMGHYYVCLAEHHRLTEHYDNYLSQVIVQTQAEKDELQYHIAKNEHERWRLFVWCEHYRERLTTLLTSHLDISNS